MTNFLVIMVTGGDHATSRSVELVDTNGTQICSLSGLPLKKYHHAQNGVTSCGGYDSPARFLCHTLSSSHTMPGDSSTSSVVFKSGTITTQPHSHVGMRICWSLKLSKAKFCTVAKIRGEIRKHLKCVIWVFTP